MFTYFTDRDGKYQLLALAESAFDPLSRTTRFMLTEEAHHMFVGETGILRVVQRSCELAKLDANGDVRAEGGVDLPTIQKYLNFWFARRSTCSAARCRPTRRRSSPRGSRAAPRRRPRGPRRPQRHLPHDDPGEGGALVDRDVALRSAMNEVLRDEYVGDCQRGVDKWNRAIGSRIL
jgi:benzoyl-CoA 2,3-dioxygenase component B